MSELNYEHLIILFVLNNCVTLSVRMRAEGVRVDLKAETCRPRSLKRIELFLMDCYLFASHGRSDGLEQFIIIYFI